MDLMNIGTTKETSDVILYNPINSEILVNDDKSEMTITIHGPYSKKYKTISHAQQNRRLMKAQRTGGKLNLTAEELEASALDLLVKCVDGWKITLGGDKPKCTEAKVREVFETLPWVREQVDSALGDAQAFLDK
tara:strand:+ start:3243 stop:3644 length:402 start_codon:yes stop_codon:yes gene_type:complete